MRSELEPGCKAIIIGGRCKENIGKIITCLNYVGTHKDKLVIFADHDLWEVDKKITFRGNSGESIRELNLCSAKTTQRIDDHPEEETLLETIKIES